jgi:hypothetical protein
MENHAAARRGRGDNIGVSRIAPHDFDPRGFERPYVMLWAHKAAHSSAV